jgi:hypothetical protein
VGGKKALILVEGLQPCIVLLEQKPVEVLRFVSQLLADLVHEFPETGRRLLCSHHCEEGVVAERFIAFETDPGEFEPLPPVLRKDEGGTDYEEESDIKGSAIHREFKKKPSRETLGSNLAHSVFKEGNLI